MILEQQIPVLFPGLAKAIPLPGQPLADEPPKKRQKIDQVIDDRYYTKELDRSTLIEGLAERGQDSAGEAAVPETQSQAQSQSGTMHSQQTTAAQAAGLPTGDSLPAGIPASLASLLPQPPLTFSRKVIKWSQLDRSSAVC